MNKLKKSMINERLQMRGQGPMTLYEQSVLLKHDDWGVEACVDMIVRRRKL